MGERARRTTPSQTSRKIPMPGSDHPLLQQQRIGCGRQASEYRVEFPRAEA